MLDITSWCRWLVTNPGSHCNPQCGGRAGQEKHSSIWQCAAGRLLVQGRVSSEGGHVELFEDWPPIAGLLNSLQDARHFQNGHPRTCYIRGCLGLCWASNIVAFRTLGEARRPSSATACSTWLRRSWQVEECNSSWGLCWTPKPNFRHVIYINIYIYIIYTDKTSLNNKGW